MMSIADQPVEQYGNLYTTSMLGPAEVQAQTALQNQAAYQSAAAQQDIQSRVDPLAYAQRQMRLKASTDRLGQLYGQDPSAFNFRAPSAYTVPGTAGVPALGTIAGGAQNIARNLATASVNAQGANPQLVLPKNPPGVAPTSGSSYF
jgi:Tfp pilus assembly protein PilV